VTVTDSVAAKSLIYQGLKRRHTFLSAQNSQSSRSHALITITLQQLKPAQQQQQQQQEGAENVSAAAAVPDGQQDSSGSAPGEASAVSDTTITG
jgi:hypothetical protein